MSLPSDVVLELAVQVKYAYTFAPSVNQKNQIVVHEEIADLAYHTFLCGFQRNNPVFGCKYGVGVDDIHLHHAAVVLYFEEALLLLVHQWEVLTDDHSVCSRLSAQRRDCDFLLCS